MSKFVCTSATLLVLLSIFVSRGDAISCWDCNSAHDPRCGEHNFDQHTLGSVDCAQLERKHLSNYQAKYCRKIIQKIGTETRVIRGCGWLKDTKAAGGRCYTRTGTKDVMVTYCQCEGDNCNAATSIFTGYIAILMVPLLILVNQF